MCPAFAVGVRLEDDGRITVAAPFGLDDLFAMRLAAHLIRYRPIKPAAFDLVCAWPGAGGPASPSWPNHWPSGDRPPSLRCTSMLAES